MIPYILYYILGLFIFLYINNHLKWITASMYIQCPVLALIITAIYPISIIVGIVYIGILILQRNFKFINYWIMYIFIRVYPN